MGPFSLNPDGSFVLFSAGVVAIYYELIRPGRIIPGVAGVCAAVGGGYSLWERSPAKPALILFAVALLLFCSELVWNTRAVAATGGVLALAGGAVALFPGSKEVHAAVAIPCAVLVGGLSGFMAQGIRRGRMNKHPALD